MPALDPSVPVLAAPAATQRNLGWILWAISERSSAGAQGLRAGEIGSTATFERTSNKVLRRLLVRLEDVKGFCYSPARLSGKSLILPRENLVMTLRRLITSPAIVVSLGLLLSGCQGSWLQRQMPWYHEDHVPGIKTADERIEEVDKLREEQLKTPKSADEQQKICERLAQQIDKEKDDPLVQRHILYTLAVFPQPLAGEVLKAATKDPVAETRVACCNAWVTRGGKDAVDALSQVLINDGNFDVRMAAARALGKLKMPGAAVPLAEALADGDPAMQRRVFESLKAVSGKDYGIDVAAWRQYAATVRAGDATPVATKPWWRQWW